MLSSVMGIWACLCLPAWMSLCVSVSLCVPGALGRFLHALGGGGATRNVEGAEDTCQAHGAVNNWIFDLSVFETGRDYSNSAETVQKHPRDATHLQLLNSLC